MRSGPPISLISLGVTDEVLRAKLIEYLRCRRNGVGQFGPKVKFTYKGSCPHKKFFQSEN